VNDDEVMDEIKVRKNYFDHVNEKIMWLFILGAFCFIVGFQPIFADISLQTNYNEATIVLFEATLSAIVGLILAYAENGKEGALEVLSLNNIIFFSPTGVLRAIEDTLSILVLRFVSPLVYIVISQLRLPLTVFMAHLFLEKKPTLLETQNIGVVVLGLFMFVIADDNSDNNSNSDKQYNLPLGLTLLFIAVFCKVFASIWVDYALKKRSHLSIPIQSANISLATLIPATIFCFIVNAVDEKHVSTFLDGWTVITGTFVVYILAKNWASNTIIKRFSSTTKYIIYSAATFVTFIFEIGLGIRDFTLPVFISILIICYGVSLYAHSKSTLEIIVTKTIETIVNSDSVLEKAVHDSDGDMEMSVQMIGENSDKEKAVHNSDDGDVEMSVQMIGENSK
jgi:uncharacterized membrane protein